MSGSSRGVTVLYNRAELNNATLHIQNTLGRQAEGGRISLLSAWSLFPLTLGSRVELHGTENRDMTGTHGGINEDENEEACAALTCLYVLLYNIASKHRGVTPGELV